MHATCSANAVTASPSIPKATPCSLLFMTSVKLPYNTHYVLAAGFPTCVYAVPLRVEGYKPTTRLAQFTLRASSSYLVAAREKPGMLPSNSCGSLQCKSNQACSLTCVQQAFLWLEAGGRGRRRGGGGEGGLGGLRGLCAEVNRGPKRIQHVLFCHSNVCTRPNFNSEL